MKEISDEQILNGIRNKDHREYGYRLLLEKYQERLYWAIRRIVIMHDDADDVMQNTLIKVCRHIDGFEEKSSLYTWLYRIAANEALSFVKRRKRRRMHGTDAENMPLANRLAADPYFDGDAANRALHEAVYGLPDKQKLVFQLRYFEDMPYRDISEILGTSEGALKASFHHAVKKVEKHLVKHHIAL